MILINLAATHSRVTGSQNRSILHLNSHNSQYFSHFTTCNYCKVTGIKDNRVQIIPPLVFMPLMQVLYMSGKLRTSALATVISSTGFPGFPLYMSIQGTGRELRALH